MFRLDPVIGNVIEGCFAMLFALACMHKLHDLKAFGAVFSAYGVVPGMLVRPISVVTALGELTVAVALTMPSVDREADWVAAALLLVYGAAMAVSLLRGRHDLRCGCLGSGRNGRISGALVSRNVLMALLLGVTAQIPWGARPLTWPDICTITFAVAALMLLCAAMNGLAGLTYRQYGGAIGQ